MARNQPIKAGIFRQQRNISYSLFRVIASLIFVNYKECMPIKKAQLFSLNNELVPFDSLCHPAYANIRPLY